MLYKFHHLQGVPPDKICQVFNESFSDYIIPLALTPAMLQQKIAGENIRLEYSAGAFSNEQLAGFILHGRDDAHPATLYNGATGVVPAARGLHLVQELYGHFIPSYRQQGVEQILLEVISTNVKAIKAYQNSGFTPCRRFECFKGEIRLQKRVIPDIIIQKSPLPAESILAPFADQVPSWSNSLESVRREKQHTTTWIALSEQEIVGYISVYLANRRIRQIGVRKDMRRKGIGTALLQQAAEVLDNPFTLVNVDEGNVGMIAFLEHSGMTRYLSQYEMSLSI